MASLGASGLTGVTSFELMQQGERLTYFAFDLLELDGEDIARLPLVERKSSWSLVGDQLSRDTGPASAATMNTRSRRVGGVSRRLSGVVVGGERTRPSRAQARAGHSASSRTRGSSSRGFAPMKRGEHLWFAGSQRHVVRTVGRSPAK